MKLSCGAVTRRPALNKEQAMRQARCVHVYRRRSLTHDPTLCYVPAMSDLPASRKGKKIISAWVDPKLATAIRVAAAESNKTVQSIVIEALETWLGRRAANKANRSVQDSKN